MRQLEMSVKNGRRASNGKKNSKPEKDSSDGNSSIVVGAVLDPKTCITMFSRPPVGEGAEKPVVTRRSNKQQKEGSPARKVMTRTEGV